MGCFDNIIKSLLFVFNFVCVLCGAAILGLGIWVTVNYNTFDKVNETSVTSPPGVMIAIGAVILLVAILGCIGACCDNSCMLTSYSILLLLLFVAQVAVGIIIIVNGKDVGEPVTKVLRKEFENAVSDKSSFNFYEGVQKSLKCCGVTGPADYISQSFNPRLYASCCDEGTTVCLQPYTTGCATKVTDFIQNNSTIFGGIAIGIAIFEVLAAVAGFATASYVKRKN